MKKLWFILFFVLLFEHVVFADGTRQLMPKDESGNHKGYCYIALGSREGGSGPSREFARYNHSNKVSCNKLNRLYFRIKDAGETVYLGFGGLRYNGADYSSSKQVNNFPLGTFAKYRIIKDDDGSIAKAEADVPTSSGPGYITSYNQAYIGPNAIVGGTGGYEPIVVSNLAPGLYYLEFDIGCDYNVAAGNPLDFKWFDITVADAQNKAIDGRVYSMAWGLNSDGSENQVWSTFYTFSTDGYVSKVYFSGIKPYRFVFGCNSYGALKNEDLTPEERRQSQPNVNSFEPEYKIFLTNPDPELFRYSDGPKEIENLTFAGDAITCEDLLFVVKLLGTESVTLELFMDLDDDDETDKVLIERLEPVKNKERGYHYPWKDNPELKEAGVYYYYPIADGCPREYKLSLFDQRFMLGVDVYNVGDTLKGDFNAANLPEPSWSKSSTTSSYPVAVGTKNNPILISSKKQLEDMAAALSGTVENYSASDGDDGKYMFYYTIDNFLYDSEEPHNPIPKTFSFSGKNGFKDLYFYIIAPTGTINLDASWPGIGTANNPFRGNIGSGRYNPNPMTDNENEGRAELAGDQCAITFGNATHGLFNYCEGATIDNIHTEGTISIQAEQYLVTPNFESAFGSICSVAELSDFSYCKSNTKINGLSDNDIDDIGYTGGIVGYASICSFDHCENFEEISVLSSVDGTGGIIGFLDESNSVYDTGYSKISYCFNHGKISALESVGGIVGYDVGISQYFACRNEGFIEAEDQYAGGIIGYMEESDVFSMKDCYNIGSIKTDGYASGLFTCNINAFNNDVVQYCANVGEIISSSSSSDEISQATRGIYTYPMELDDGTNMTIADFMQNYNNDGHFYLDENGQIGLLETMCLGRTWRNENAGRLYSDDNTYYIPWDGKFDNGDCVTGKLTVSYRKASGVTHFPFYDPEKIEITQDNQGNNDELDVLKGLVVYRVSPILEKELAESAPEALPEGYYQTNVLSTEEKGYELKLYWDDRKISYGNTCTMAERDGFVYGRTVTTPAEYKLEKTAYWLEWDGQCSKYTSIKDGDGKTVTVCKTLAKKAVGKEYFYKKTLVTSEKSMCQGIENVNLGGYYGSEAGGHAFPINLFGDKNTMNTWWNGVEVKKELALELYENSPAVLLSIEIATWTVKNEKNSVLLEWSTSSEENNETFQIERSYDGRRWERIGSLFGAGTTSTMHYYSFVDEEPLDGISYYRLKQVDFDGDYSYSSIKTVNRGNNSKNNLFKAYAIESENIFVVEGRQIAACPISVYDVYGRLVAHVSYHTISTDKVVISVKDIAPGTYIIRSCDTAKPVVKHW